MKQYANAKNLTWRMWWDGEQPGPIVKQYQVHSWPTVYVLDDHGVVRQRNLRGPELEQAVDALLRELPAKRRARDLLSAPALCFSWCSARRTPENCSGPQPKTPASGGEHRRPELSRSSAATAANPRPEARQPED